MISQYQTKDMQLHKLKNKIVNTIYHTKDIEAIKQVASLLTIPCNNLKK